MTQIGQFTRLRGLYSGRLRTLTIDVHLVLVPAPTSDHPQQPDYRIHAGDADGPEIGAAYKRVSDKAGEFLALWLDDPALPAPLRASLFQNPYDKKGWNLHWTRTPKASGLD
ncbi:DUF736 domain-containing protein [Asticcacaulis machinosus]|uniref:DUF736 domain-containing protein n=1 Tax=Asticcacaulis machinosus TaxID=2984211 RepID=A0ABT5HH00_9CAUL|nr:DUF736 domain-containing protein [Asticcacaulis machinosus]MDC7675517.1 DUF736 domain-containing protein [Asticcacaulis machinosus]